MVTTEFLPRNRFNEYGHWLKAQDPETIRDYFGWPLNNDGIDSLIEKWRHQPTENYFLVAKRNNFWAGTIHIATHENSVEFGIIVALHYRKQGIASHMMDEAITWARNRFYSNLYMHCICSNHAIKKLCEKHDLKIKSMMGDCDGNLTLPPPTPLTYLQEHARTDCSDSVNLLFKASYQLFAIKFIT
jgi:GNAT superfamily N-acetyltransferase